MTETSLRADPAADASPWGADLPADPKAVMRGEGATDSLRFIRFRPPRSSLDADGIPKPLPHIRLDRALQFLIGDRLA